MDYYIAPIDGETDFLKVSGPEELTVIDPACGSGHMLTYAFDLLYRIYDDEGYAPSEIPGLILTHNLHGTEIDPRAAALAAFALSMKGRERDRRFFTRSVVSPKICVVEPISFTPDGLDLLITKSGDRDAEQAFWNQFRDADTLGSLIQPDADATAQASVVLEELKHHEGTLYFDTLIRARKAVTQADMLSRKYSVAVANPPYMGSKNMGPCLANFAKTTYPLSKADLFAMFIDRSRALVSPRGFVGMITMQSWMFLDTFHGLRAGLLKDAPLVAMAHLGARAFDTIGGEVVSTTAFVFEPEGSGRRSAKFVRLVDMAGEARKAAAFLATLNGDPEERSFAVSSTSLSELPRAVVAYSMPEATRALFRGKRVGDVAHVHRGISTGNNERYMRSWFEVSRSSIKVDVNSTEDTEGNRWYPVNRGSYPTRWYGYGTEIIDYQGSGKRMREAADVGENPGFRHDGASEYFKETITWSAMTSGAPLFRLLPAGFVLGHKGPGIAVPADMRTWMLALLNSAPAASILRQLSGTLDILVGQIKQLPLPNSAGHERIQRLAEQLIEFYRVRFAESEDAIEFARHPLVFDLRTSVRLTAVTVEERQTLTAKWHAAIAVQNEIDEIFFDAFGLERNPEHARPDEPTSNSDVCSFVSYAVGCMFGRYSLDVPGLVLADQGASLQDYLSTVSASASGEVSFMPDADNVIPFVDDGWFEDDVVEQFRTFLKAAFGAEHFEENLRFVEESLGVKTLRDYFITKSGSSRFYDDHVKRYKKRPIYWMFSSPKGSFNALIYLHRYTSSTVSTVLNEYLREYENKLQKAFERAEKAAAGGTSAKDQKEADRLRKVLAELRDYEHDVLYPLATQQVEIDLDDGVKVNYPKFYPAVKKIVGLEANDG